MNRTLILAAILVSTVIACDEPRDPLGLPGPTDPARLVALEPAGAPTVFPVFIEFEGVNPCSGQLHTITMTGTGWLHEHDGRHVVHMQRTITTSSGFVGRGTNTFVVNGNVLTLTLNDMLAHESGDRIRAHLLLVLDVSTTPPTVRVMKGTFDGTICLGR